MNSTINSKRSLLLLIALIAIPFSQNALNAATITSNGTGGGNYGAGASWVGGVPPANGDDVIIASGDTITLTGNVTCNSMRIQGHQTRLNVGSNTLTITTDLFAEAKSANNSSDIVNNGTVDIGDEFYIQSYNFNGFDFDISGSGTIDGTTLIWWIAVTSTITGTISNSMLLPSTRDMRFLSFTNSSIDVEFTDSLSCRNFELYSFGNVNDINIDGTDANFRLRTARIREYRRGGTVDCGSAGSKVYLTSNRLEGGTNLIYNDLIVQANITMPGDRDMIINGTLELESGRTLNTNGNDLTISGNLQMDGTLNMTAGDVLTISSADAGAKTISGSGTLNFTNLTVDCSNATGGVTINDTISITENLVCEDGVFTTNGNVTMKSDENGTANIGEIGGTGSASITGEITVEKWFNGMNGVADWVYFHVPGIPENLSVINDGGTNPAGFYTFGYSNSNSPSTATYKSTYRYDETQATAGAGATDAARFEAGWTAASNANSDQFDPSAAWIFLLGGDAGVGAKDTYHISTSIQPFAAGATFSGSGSNTQTYTGWNLFGNPYASAVTIANANLTAIQGSALVVYERTGGYNALTNGDILPAFQSFFVQVQNGTNSVDFNQSDKSTNSTTQIYKKIAHQDRMNIHLTRDSAGFQSHAYLRFDDAGAIGFDGGDLYQLRNGWPHPNISLIEQDSLQFMIDNIPTDFDERHIPLKVEASSSDWHTLEFENIPDRSACYVLEDLETGDLIDLSDQKSYRFYLEDTTSAPRFLLHITKGIKDTYTEATSCFAEGDGQVIAELNPNQTFDLVWLDEANQTVRQSFDVQGFDTLNNAFAGDYRIQIVKGNGDCGFMEEVASVFEPVEVVPSFSISNIEPNVWANEVVEFTNTSKGASSFEWNFGDGTLNSTDVNPSHSYTTEGAYTVELKASNGNSNCDMTWKQVVNAVKQAPAGVKEESSNEISVIHIGEKDHIILNRPTGDYEVFVTNLIGQEVIRSDWNIEETKSFELKLPQSGVYIINVTGENFNESIKFGSQNK